MYLLYLDESGAHSRARHFILAGVAIHENSTYWATAELNRLQARYFPDAPDSIRFHAAPLRALEGERVEAPLDQLDSATRRRLLQDLYAVLHQMHGQIFAVIVEKSALPADADPYARAMEEMLPRFDRFIHRRYRQRSQRNKGMVIIATSPQQRPLADAFRQFVNDGTRHGPIHNILDIPAFTLSKHNRLLQIADLVANTVYGRYESSYAREFDRLLPKFYQSGNGPVHGLVHLPAEPALCYQPCCRHRALTGVG